MPKLRQNSTSVGASPQTPSQRSPYLPAAFKGEGREGEGEEEGQERKGGRKDEERPPTLKCRKIHSFSMFFSVIKSLQEAR